MSGPAHDGAGRVTIVDAGVGNLGNVERAFRHLGAEPEIVESAEQIRRARRLVLPGVGAFAPPRRRLAGAREEALREALDGGAWLLGICVGYQLLFERGEEHGEIDGLGLLRGVVRRLPGGEPPDGVTIPHIGWNRLYEVGEHPLVDGVAPGSRVYFVHSYAPDEEDEREWLARTSHGRSFPAISARGRVMGAQFHPEKSGEVGLRILANYLELSRESS